MEQTPIIIAIPQEEEQIFCEEKGAVSSYRLGKPISIGGEGIIYHATGGRVYKIYKQNRLTEYSVSKLRAMINEAPILDDNICWPQGLVLEPSEKRVPVGCIMRRIDTHDNDVHTLDAFVNSIHYLSTEWKWDRTHLVRLCTKIIETFRCLHKNEILMGDVNLSNILVRKNCDVYFIDTDSYQFKDFLCLVGVPEFVSPRIHRLEKSFNEIRRTIDDENFAIACLVFKILFLGSSPLPQGNIGDISDLLNHNFKFTSDSAIPHQDNLIWLNLTKRIREAFINVFTKEIYPSDDEWIDMLKELFSCMRSNFLSSEIYPSHAIDTKDFGKIKFQQAFCENCGSQYEICPGSTEKLCSTCQGLRYDNQRRIVKVRCKECGKVFTVNPWDTREIDTDDILCPDCDENTNIDKKDTASAKKLENIFNKIIKNLDAKETEELI